MTRTTEHHEPAPTGGDPAARAALGAAVARAIEGRALLTHPFYRRWEAGWLERRELAEYAVQYRVFEAALPVVLDAVVRALRTEGKLEAAAMVERNLADELGTPEPHLSLFDRFARSVGADMTQPAGPAAEALAGTYGELVRQGPGAALAGLAAYETQAAAVAATKADGLRRLYGVDDAGTEFWDVHATMDATHGEWAVDALDRCGASPTDVRTAAARAADAWWAMLDEREAEAPGSARLAAHH